MDGSMARSRFTFPSSLILVLFVAMVGTLPVRGREAKAASSVTVKSGEWRYMVNAKQYIAFTVGTPTEPAEVVSLALEK